MNRTVLLFLLLLIAPALSAQIKNVTIRGQGVFHNLNLTGERKPGKQIAGSPYLNKDYMYGSVVLANDKVVKGLLRYNVRYQNFEVVLNQDTLYISEPSMVKKVEFAGKVFVFSLSVEDINGKPFLSGGYFEVSGTEKTYPKLLIKYGKEIKESSYAPNYNGGGGTGISRYVNKREYYILKHQGAGAVRITNRKDLMSLFDGGSEEEKQMKQYISRNRLNAHREEDLRKFIRYWNKL